MSDKKFNQLTVDVNKSLGTLNQQVPDVLKQFQGLGKAATAESTLSTKTKELIALAIGVSKQCDACIAFHTQKLIKLGATREEISEALGVAVYMGGGPALMYAAEAISAFEEFNQ
jgi:AhpD family alkylhydroperoxidase